MTHNITPSPFIWFLWGKQASSHLSTALHFRGERRTRQKMTRIAYRTATNTNKRKSPLFMSRQLPFQAMRARPNRASILDNTSNVLVKYHHRRLTRGDESPDTKWHPVASIRWTCCTSYHHCISYHHRSSYTLSPPLTCAPFNRK